MTTAAENERLGVLEVEVGHIKSDVAEIKSDVKSLVASQNAVAIQLAAKDAAEAAASRTRGTTGVWFRFVAERAIALLSLAVSLFALFRASTGG